MTNNKIYRFKKNAVKISSLDTIYHTILCIGCSEEWFRKYYEQESSVTVVAMPFYKNIKQEDISSFDLIYVYDYRFIVEMEMFINQLGKGRDILLGDSFVPVESISLLPMLLKPIRNDNVYNIIGSLVDDDGDEKIYSDGSEPGFLLYGPYTPLAAGEYCVNFKLSCFPDMSVSDKYNVCKLSCEIAPDTILTERIITSEDLKYSSEFTLKFTLAEEQSMEFKVYSYGVVPLAVNVERECKKNIELEVLAYDDFSYKFSNDLIKSVLSDNFFSQKLQTMLYGLSEADKELIEHLIKRLLIQSEHKTIYKQDLTVNEYKEYITLKNDFYNRIVKKDEYYLINGYKFLTNDIAPASFFYKLGLDSIDTSIIIGKAAIDAGAYIGDTAIVLAEYNPSMVYAFEPVQVNFENLQHHISINNIQNIIPVNKALGAEDKQETITVKDGASSIVLHSDLNNMCEQETINITTLDSYVCEHGFEVGIIKIDTEGYERYVLEGAKYVIKIQKPIIILSIYHNIDDLLELKGILEQINNTYQYKVIKMMPHSRIIDTVLLCY